ncbi:coiled-coil domain-containing protein [Nitrococcus mobilis]|nr:hypothetical protein [Nitrococcus mobilis]
MPEKLKKFYENQRDLLQAAKTETQGSLGQAQVKLREARNAQTQCTQELATLERGIAENRRAMAQALMPSDVEALAEQLRKLIIGHRNKQRALLDAEQRVDEAQRAQSRAAAELSRTTSRLSQAETELAEAGRRLERFENWKNALASPPLSDLKANAESVRDGDFKEAKARVKEDIPAELYNRAVQRRDRQLERLTTLKELADDAEDKLAEKREKDQGTAQRVARRWTRYRMAEADLGDYVQRSKERYDLAVALLGRINKSTDLTQAQRGRIKALMGAGKNAISAEIARDEALWAVETKEVELSKKTRELNRKTRELRMSGAGPDDLDADEEVQALRADVQKLKDDLAALKTELTTKESEYSKLNEAGESMRSALDAWEASVPDHIWANLDALNRAETLLEDLVDEEKAKALLNAVNFIDVDSPQTLLVNALEKHAKSVVALDDLQAAAEQAREDWKFAEQIRQRLLLSATRGDSPPPGDGEQPPGDGEQPLGDEEQPSEDEDS